MEENRDAYAGYQLLQGTLDMLILKALSLGPLHGYGIGQRIMQMSEDLLRVEEGSLYPVLYRSNVRDGSTPNGACRRTISAPSSTS
jgi:hypothetical protein